MITCKDCIYFEACYELNSELKKYPKDYLESDKCASQCTTFKNRNTYMDAEKVLSYISRVRGRIITSSAVDCALYDHLNVFEHIFKSFTLPPAKLEGESDGH